MRRLLLALLLAACGGDDAPLLPDLGPGPGPADLGPAPTMALQGVALFENPRNVLSYDVEWTTPVPATTVMEVRCGDERVGLFTPPGLRLDHRVFVMGLVPEATCVFRLRSTDESGQVAGQDETVQVAPLPALVDLDVRVTFEDASELQPGWTLLHLNNTVSLPVLLYLDAQGRVRWYRLLEQIGNDTEVTRQPEGILVGGAGGGQPHFIGWDGAELWGLDGTTANHDIRRYPDAHSVTFITFRESCGGFDNIGTVATRDMRTGERTYEWSVCDAITPPLYFEDWAHLNTFEPIAEEGAFLTSARNQNQVYKVDMATGEVLWRLGEGGDFAMPEQALFQWQHSPELQPDGHIVLFDNGEPGRRESSRAIELALDETAMTAELVWEFVPSDGLWTPTYGDADRLANGNTLVNFGERNTARHAYVIEARPDGTEAWRLRLPLGYVGYRADRDDIPPLLRFRDELPRELFDATTDP